ncbi:MAG: agmatinase [Pseudomonadota bacterium]
MSETIPQRQPHATFLFAEPDDIETFVADVAVLGVPYGQPYGMRGLGHDQVNGAEAIRRASDRVVRDPSHFDFDWGGPLFMGRRVRMVDLGDVRADPYTVPATYPRTREAVEAILEAGALPLVLGGDHSIPIPVIEAYRRHGPITVVQIDAHLDWREEVGGVTHGLSSPMRRVSEMDHVAGVVQVGLRGQGSARPEDFRAAVAAGAQLVTATALHRDGVGSVLAALPEGGRYYLTVDMDGLDPSCAPAVHGPAPDGVSFAEARDLIHGMVARGRIVGMDVVELTPSTDVNRLTAITAGRLFANLIGAMCKAGQLGR